MMKGMTPEAMAKAAGGRYHGPEELKNKEISAVTTDSRQVTEGCLFVPIKGERVDGHDFIPQVMEKGAMLTLTEHAEGVAEYPYILVESTRKAIQQIAGLYRRNLDLTVVGVTGSVGKTSTKEMIASVLSERFRVLKTAGNFNNNLGLPLTIFRLTEEDEVAVLEMGISHFGEMTELAETAEPDIMVITNIGECHLEFLGDRDGVLAAKTECFDYVKLDGTVILNGEDDKLATVEDVHGKRPVFYGRSPRFRVYAEDISPKGLTGSTCTITVDEESVEVTVPAPGIHMVMNALAAAAVGSYLGLSLDEVRKGIEKYSTLAGRFNIRRTGRFTVIDDCYNASPASVKASVEILKEADGRRAAILGDMGELGKDTGAIHRRVGRECGEAGIDLYAVVGTLSSELAAGIRETNPGAAVREFGTVEEALEHLGELLEDGDTVLVKASHFMHFERITERICGL